MARSTIKPGRRLNLDHNVCHRMDSELRYQFQPGTGWLKFAHADPYFFTWRTRGPDILEGDSLSRWFLSFQPLMGAGRYHWCVSHNGPLSVLFLLGSHADTDVFSHRHFGALYP